MKFNEYQKLGAVVFISKKFQNSNAAKVDDGQKEAVLTQMIAHHNNLDNTMIAGYYNKVADMQGWERITASTVGVWKEKLDLVTAAGRRGATNFRNERSMQVKRRRPSAAFLMWTLDGWDCELLYQTVKEDAQGHHVTTYSNRLCLEVVLDPCCDYPIGYAIGTHETPALITEALRNAAQHSAELAGQMLRANQLQCDHYGIKAMTPLYLAMSDKLTPARVKNAKAKPVEAYFGYLNKNYCQRCNNWSGFGITTDPKKQPNSEALNMLRHQFPDEEGVRQQIHAIIAADRQKKHAQMMQMLANLPAERRLPLTKENYLLYFGDTTGQTNAICGGGLKPTLLGVKREYDSFDLTFRQHAGEKWRVAVRPERPKPSLGRERGRDAALHAHRKVCAAYGTGRPHGGRRKGAAKGVRLQRPTGGARDRPTGRSLPQDGGTHRRQPTAGQRAEPLLPVRQQRATQATARGKEARHREHQGGGGRGAGNTDNAKGQRRGRLLNILSDKQ